CGDKAVSWYEFAQAIFSLFSDEYPALRSIEVCPISTAAFKQQACRPMNSVMQSERVASQASCWDKALGMVMSA
ncbi:sugar nucleotide-binding protein, partial [Mixta calida]